MNAGKLDKRIEIQKLGNQKDADGYQVEVWLPARKIPAMVIPVSAKEYHQAKTNQSENTTRFVVRYNKSLYTLLKQKDGELAISYKGGRFEIESVINDFEKSETITIIGVEVI